MLLSAILFWLSRYVRTCLLSLWITPGERLAKQEVEGLLSGNTAKGTAEIKMEISTAYQNRIPVIIKFHEGGHAEKTVIRGIYGHYFEDGKWWVKDDGQLCMKWKEGKRGCSYLVRTSEGKYELHSKKGKTRALIFDKIVPGTS